ncbi:peptidase inhibitor family I36 protein [Streptomyces sp. NPDC054854]
MWDAPNASGVHQEYQQSTSYVGDAMNDRASSIALL